MINNSIVLLHLIENFLTNHIIPFEIAIRILSIFFLIILIGLAGICVNWHNLLFTIFSIEIINISAIIYLSTFSRIINDFNGFILANLLLWLTASESALILGILVVLFKFGGTIKLNSYTNLQG